MPVRSVVGITCTFFAYLALAGCVSMMRSEARVANPIAVKVIVAANEQVLVTYNFAAPAKALHFAQQLGGYRQEDWHPTRSGFRWVTEGSGERIERTDGGSFDQVTVRIPLRYRALLKSYAPFSPFSEGSTLIHTGQFHACLHAPCKGTDSLPITIAAPGETIGVQGRRVADRVSFVSSDEGTNVFVGTLSPVAADGFVAIIDPGLPGDLRQHLTRSLPRAINSFAEIYGSLSFRPELYVSIDARAHDGKQSMQGGTLPGQIFMHFDGDMARERFAEGSPFWLDWFFAHEAAHLFQQDKIGKLAGDDEAAWIHEGGADAMAALELAKRGDKEQAYIEQRVHEAETACVSGLEHIPLGRASATSNFDLHYQCGLLIWLALDGELRRADQNGLNALNKVFFSRVRAGEPWDIKTFLSSAQELEVSGKLLQRIQEIHDGGYADSSAEVAGLKASLVLGNKSR